MDRINYIRQLNAFWNMQGENGHLKPTSYSVYFSLLQINNTCGWKDPFLATYTQVLNMTGIGNAKTYYSALDELSKRGYVTWLKSKNQYQAPSFSIKVLYQNLEEQLHSMVKAPTLHTEEQLHSTVSIPKQLNKKQENIKTKDDSFDLFWNLYDKKTGKDKVQKRWTALTNEDHTEILKVVPVYVKSTPEKKFRKDPLTYLNGGHWKDEIINTQNPTEHAGEPEYVFGAKPLGYTKQL